MLIYSVVFLAIFLGLQFYRAKFAPQTPPPQQHENHAAASENGAAGSQPETGSAAAGGNAASATPAVQGASESETVIENSLYRITFTNRGAQVKSWILKKYKDED